MREIVVKMSKRKGLSFEEKRVRLKELFTETVCVERVPPRGVCV